jgi:prephenate dehydrogenase (NADP+)
MMVDEPDNANVTLICQGWSDCVSFGDFASYQDRFEKIKSSFVSRFPDAKKKGDDMMRAILDKSGTAMGIKSAAKSGPIS